MASCVAFGCTNNPARKVPGITFHIFPKDEFRRKQWTQAVRRKNWMPSHYSKLCSSHFPEDMIDRTSSSVVRLRENAIPRIFPTFPPHSQKVGNDSRCFVPGCSTGYPNDRKRCKEEGSKVKTLFSAPADPKLFEAWKQRISRTDKEFARSSKVCELHFPEEEITRNDVVNLPDGSVFTSERLIPLLKPGSIPSILPSPPKYLKQPKRKTKISLPCNIDSLSTSESLLKNEENQKASKVTFFDIVQNIGKITLPNKWWGVHAVDCLIVFARWNDKGAAERRLVLRSDSSIKAYLYAQELKIDLTVICQVEDISGLLQHIDEYTVCSGVFMRL